MFVLENNILVHESEATLALMSQFGNITDDVAQVEKTVPKNFRL